MSARLAMRVWESDLPPHLKATAGVLALFANDDGERIYPSIPRVAWLLGKSARRTTADVTCLCNLGVLIPVTPRTGGGGRRGRTTHYELDISALPCRDAWAPQPGHSRQPFSGHNPDAGVSVAPAEPGHQRLESLTPVAGTLTSTAQTPDAHVIRSFRDHSLESSESKSPAATRTNGSSRKNSQQEIAVRVEISAITKRLLSEPPPQHGASLRACVVEELARQGLSASDEDLSQQIGMVQIGLRLGMVKQWRPAISRVRAEAIA